MMAMAGVSESYKDEKMAVTKLIAVPHTISPIISSAAVSSFKISLTLKP
jgi:hypothetical protein